MIGSGGAQFELLESVLGASTAIVSEENLPRGELKPGVHLNLFLESLTTAGNWLCRTWAPQDNPWLNGRRPRPGEIVSGSIVRFINDWMAVANIAIDGTHIEALLPSQNLPSRGPLSHHLSVGDRIRAEVETVEIDRLRCRLDVSAWRRTTNQAAEEENRRYKKAMAGNAPPRPPERPPRGEILAGRRILVVDDDKRLCQSLVNWLGYLGAKTGQAQTSASAATVVSQLQPTHILVDYDLGGLENFPSLAKAFAKTTAKVAIFTGSPDLARDDASRLGWGLLEKPADLMSICAWIDGSVAPETTTAPRPARSRSGHWSVDVQTQAITREAGDLLERLCQRHQCVAALWLVQEREDVFDLGAQTKQIDEKLAHTILADLPRSVVNNAISQQKPTAGVVPGNDPLQPLMAQLGLRTPHYVAIPVLKLGLQPRVIVFLRNSPPDSAVVENLAGRADHFELLIRAIQQATHSEQVETFATQGRIAAGTVHEMRNAMQIFESGVGELNAAIAAGDLAQAKAASGLLAEDMERLRRSIGSSLELVKAQRRDRLNVDRVVEGIVERMRRIAHDFHQDHPVTILFEPSGTRVVTAISPAPLEQALVNLIENAIGFLPRRDWAQIKVRVVICEDDLTMPIHVEVIDNGPGLGASQFNRLFEPRVTSKNKLGTGLGLYVSRNLLADSGGALDLVETSRWGGAHFRIRLPAILDAMDDEVRG
jgi:signal transduction histidine kinase